MTKPFLTYEQQIDKLVNEKNLIVEDHEYAISILKKVSYFALICGYKDPFKNLTTKKYNDGISINHIIELYKFDEMLREQFLKYMMKIERNIRSLISYYFCEKFGDDQKGYLDVNNYDYTSWKKIQINEFVGILSDLTSSNNHKYISHHRSQHNNVPLWVLTNAMTFGQISKMYTFLQQSTQSSVAKNFPGIMSPDLAKMLGSMTKYRNVCAHGERLFSFRIQDGIPNMDLHKKMNIPQKGQQYMFGKNDLFAVVIMLKYLLYPNDFTVFIENLKAIIQQYTTNLYSLNTKTLLTDMGFPESWEDVSKF